MKKNGYTLVELLGIMSVMAIMLLIIVPNVMTIMKNTDKQKSEIFEKMIEQAAESYTESNIDLFPELLNNDRAFRKVQTLIDSGYLKSTLVDPSTNEEINGNSYFVVKVNDDMTKTYDYLKNSQPLNLLVDKLLTNSETYTYMNGIYLKGDISNNYVWYNGFIWRIMGKNNDGSIRLIVEENVAEIPWGPSNSSQDYANSYIKEWINTYFLSHLKDTASIVTSSFCEDSTFITSNSNAMRETCSKPVSAKVGILTLDEYMLSGGTSSYLNLDQITWMMTPSSSSAVWRISGNNSSGGGYSVTSSYGVRPIISISPDTIVGGGSGILTSGSDTEYILDQTLEDITGTLKNNSSSGEYVKFDDRIYRVVEHTDEGTKLILDGYYTNSSAYGTNFATLQPLLTGNSLLKWLAPNKYNYILTTNWYRGSYWTGGDYKNLLKMENNTNLFESKIGLIKIGEMLSGQSLSILTNNYSAADSDSNAKSYWTLTPYSSSSSWYIYGTGYATYSSVTGTQYVRPVIMLPSDTKIYAGAGVLSNPYLL